LGHIQAIYFISSLGVLEEYNFTIRATYKNKTFFKLGNQWL